MTETIVEPTHDKQGRTVYFCNDCEYTYESNFVAPLGHAMTKEVHEPTCTDEGYTYNFCQCGYHFNSDYVAPLPHALALTEEVAPTCDREGYKIFDCTRCGEHRTYDVAAPLGHELTEERGFVSLTDRVADSHYTCSTCGLDYIGNNIFYKDVYHGAYVDTSDVLTKGIDVSKHNHNIDNEGNYLPLDWNLIKSSGYDFVILRAGYMGSGNIFVTDPVFEMDYTAAKAAGLGVGAYIYSYAYTVEDARAEAQAMLTTLAGKQFEYPIYFDIEYSDDKITEKGLTPEGITSICNEFISIMQDGGYFTALYTNNKWLTEYLIKEEVTVAFDIWYARYLYADKTIVVNEATWNSELYGAQMAMWQFSETGNIDGIYDLDKGADVLQAFDLNYCYKDYPTLIKKYGLNGFLNSKDLSQLDKEI